MIDEDDLSDETIAHIKSLFKDRFVDSYEAILYGDVYSQITARAMYACFRAGYVIGRGEDTSEL